MIARGQPWVEGNQRYLMAALAEVGALLVQHARRRDGATEPAPQPSAPGAGEIALGLVAPPALEAMRAAFHLSEFERAVVLACAGVDLEASFGEKIAAAHGDPRRNQLTFGLALATFPQAHWSALAPTGQLRRFRLVELGPGDSLTQAPLRVDERVLHYLAGVHSLDERLLGLVTAVSAAHDDLAPSQRAIAERIGALLARAEPGRPPPLVQLCGRDPAGLRAVAACAASELGLGLCSISAADVPGAPAERDMLMRLWEREAALSGTALHLELEDASAESARSGVAFAERSQAVILITCREPVHLRRRSAVRFEVDRPTSLEQEALWRSALGPVAGRINGQLERVVSQFNLGAPAIRAASLMVEAAEDPGAALWSACCGQAQPRLAELAQRLQPSATSWDDLVLPEEERGMLQDLVAQVLQRRKVYETWGFAEKSCNGMGVSALFAGPSGTGKTMAAEILAHLLELDLYRIDLSQVVSKFIGETEKNLRRVFDAAEDGGAILLFDEADALFGKRSEVKDSHDRYANIEVGYLLQRMETYRGLAILTTNMRDSLDPAFLRRIRFVVQFPFPAAAQRAEIWRRIFPPRVPTEGLDLHKLAGLHVAGGNIRNIALNAAFLAAAAGEPVRMRHLLRAAQGEMAKNDRKLGEAEVREWT